MSLHDPSGAEGRRERRSTAGAAAFFGLVAALACADLIADLMEGTTVFHLLVEGGLLAVGLLGAVVMAGRLAALTRAAQESALEAAELTARLVATGQEAERWRQEAGDLLRGLGASIDDQLDRWKLTPAEKEVALLLLKGLSLKEAGEVRQVSESTTRQQARAVYRKAGLSGRSELAAFFLEDLLSPPVGR